MNAISEIDLNSTPGAPGSSAAASFAGLGGGSGFAQKLASAVQQLFGPLPALPAVTPAAGNAEVGTADGNAPSPAANANSANPPAQRKSGGNSSNANAASSGLTIAVAWVAMPAQFESAAAAGATTASGLGQGGSAQGVAGMAGAVASQSSAAIPAAQSQNNAQGLREIGPVPPLPAPAVQDGNNGAGNLPAKLSQSGLQNVMPLSGPPAASPAQRFGEAGTKPVANAPAGAPVASIPATEASDGQQMQTGIRATAAQRNIPQASAESVPVPAATDFSDSQITQAQTANEAGAVTGERWSAPPAQPAAEGTPSSFAGLTAEEASPLPPANPPAATPLEKNAEPAEVPAAAPNGQADAAVPAAVAAVLAAANAAESSVSLSSALPATANVMKAPLRAAAANASSNNAASSSKSGAVSNPASIPLAVGNLKSSEAGGETPFAVFFPANGTTESAAAVLPKMIVPAAASASPHMNNVQTGAVSAAGAGQSVSGSSNAPPAAKNPSGGNSGGSSAESTAGTAASHSGDTSLATAGVTSGQTAMASAAPAAALPPNAGGQIAPVVIAPAGGQAVPVETAAKAGTLPASAANPENAPVVAQSVPQPAPGPVQVAQMASRAGQAEMRIGMNTSAFGSVEVKTVIHASDVGLTIGSEKGDLRGLLTNELPAISNNLQQQNLRLSNVSFLQGFASGSDMAGGGSAQQQGRFAAMPSYASPSPESGETTGGETADMLAWQAVSYASGSLSILA